MKLVAPLEHRSMFGNECERPLLQLKLGAFLDANFRTLGRPPEGRKYGHVRVEPHAVIAPVTGRYHPAVEVENALQLRAVK